MDTKVIRRGGYTALSKGMLLPLSTAEVRAVTLENHIALATVRAGRGDSGQIVNLLRVVYLAFYLRDETVSGADIDLYRRAEAALDACIERAERGEKWLLLDHERATVERVLVVHDELLTAVPKYRYVAAWDRLQHFITGKARSPIRAKEETA